MKSEAQVYLERRAWARSLLICAYRRKLLLGPAATIKVEIALADAIAIAEEWGIGARSIMAEEINALKPAKESA